MRYKLKTTMFVVDRACSQFAYENIRFSSLFAARDVSFRSSARNVSSGEERGETDVFAG